MNANKENAEGLGCTSAKRHKRKLSTPERELSVIWKKVKVRVCNEGTSHHINKFTKNGTGAHIKVRGLKNGRQ